MRRGAGFSGRLGAPWPRAAAADPFPGPGAPRCHRRRARPRRAPLGSPLPLPGQRRRLLRAGWIVSPRHFQTAPAPEPCLGQKEPTREAGSRTMRPQAEGAAAGAAGEGGLRGLQDPAGRRRLRLPGGPRGPGPGAAGREAARPREEVGPGGAGRGGAPQAPLPTPLPFNPGRQLWPEVVPGLPGRLLSGFPRASGLCVRTGQPLTDGLI